MSARRALLRFTLFLSAVALLAQGGDPARPRRELESAKVAAREAEKKLQVATTTARSIASSLDSGKIQAARLDAVLATLEAQQSDFSREIGKLDHRRDSVEKIRATMLDEYSQVARALLKQQLMTPAASALLLPAEHRRLALKQRLFDRYARQQSARAVQIRSAERFLARQDSILRRKESDLAQLVARRRAEIVAVLEQQGSDSASLERARVLRQALAELVEQKQEKVDQISALMSSLVNTPRPKPRVTPPPTKPSRTSETAASPRFTWPVSGRQIVRGYGSVRNRATGTVTINPGIDIASTQGAPVRSVEAGTVSMVSWLPGYSTIVIVEHSGGYRTVYANLEATDIAIGREVEPGEVLGSVGTTENGTFLHFEIWKNQTRLDPTSVLGKK